MPDTATATPASVTNDVSATPAASPARSGRTTAWDATVVNAYTRPMVKPHAVSAIRYPIHLPDTASAASETAAAAQETPMTSTGGYLAASRPDSGPPSAAPTDGPRNARPTISGSRPRTCCRFSVES